MWALLGPPKLIQLEIGNIKSKYPHLSARFYTSNNFLNLHFQFFLEKDTPELLLIPKIPIFIFYFLFFFQKKYFYLIFLKKVLVDCPYI